MKAPAFWSGRRPGVAAQLLRPIGTIYGAVTARRMARKGERLGIPVIAIGNFTAGGAGKTPTAIALARHLIAKGRRPVFITRGYGGRLTGPVLGDPRHHGAVDVGDEPLLLARIAPTIMSADRAAGGRRAMQHGDIIILDDALQNPGLVKDITIAVIDADAGFGNGLCLPAGPLRAPVAAQAAHVDAVLFIGKGRFERPASLAAKPWFGGELVTSEADLAPLRGQPIIAFAGIGRPGKFFAHLKAAGLDIWSAHGFGDHHDFTEAELAALAKEAKASNAILLTTEKDLARIGSAKHCVSALPVSLEAPELMEWVLAQRCCE